MQVMAQGWVLTSLSASASTLGWFNLVGSLPMLLLGMRGGEVADRHEKRRVLLLTQVAMMLLALGFGGLIFNGALQLWHVFALGFITSVVEAFEFPAAQGLAPELVKPEEIRHAVAMMQSIFHAGRLVGPAVGGLLISRFGEGSAFLANGVSFAAVIAALVWMGQPPGPRAPLSPDSGRFHEAWTFVRTDGVTRQLFTLLCLALLLVFPFSVMLVFYARHTLGADATSMGDVLSASGVGALVGTGILLWASHIPWHQRLWTACMLCCLSILALALNTTLVGGMLLAGLLSLATSLLMGTLSQTIQVRIPGALRGRVSALMGMAFTSVLPLAAVVLGELADVLGLPALMFACAALFAAGSAYTLLRAT
jgi:MFS family permease